MRGGWGNNEGGGLEYGCPNSLLGLVKDEIQQMNNRLAIFSATSLEVVLIIARVCLRPPVLRLCICGYDHILSAFLCGRPWL